LELPARTDVLYYMDSGYL